MTAIMSIEEPRPPRGPEPEIVQKPRLYRVSMVAVKQARELGIAGSVVERLQRMAMRSAPVTHPEGNRRFDDFVLAIEDKPIVGGEQDLRNYGQDDLGIGGRAL